jgi:hypothetical protein
VDRGMSSLGGHGLLEKFVFSMEGSVMEKSRRFYYFVNSEWGINDLELHRIKVARIEDANDPFELFPFKTQNNNITSANDEMKASINRGHGFICLSGGWDNPVIWSHYADRHKGMCFGFELQNLEYRHVDYIKNRIEYSEKKHGKFEIFAGILLFTKYEYWTYENEFRILIILDNMVHENGLYFHPINSDLCLKEIILGQRFSRSWESMKQLITRTDPKIQLIKAKLDDLEYKIVPDPRYS